MKKWTQDEAIAFECARECITHHGQPADGRCAELAVEIKRLARPLSTRRGSLRARFRAVNDLS